MYINHMKGGVASFNIRLQYSLITGDGPSDKKLIINKEVDLSEFSTDGTLENKFFSFIPPAYKNRNDIINVILTSKYDYESLPYIPLIFMDDLYGSPKVIYNTITSLMDRFKIFIVEIYLRKKKHSVSLLQKASKKKKNKKKQSKKRIKY